MKKWLISMMAVATLMLAGSALADGNITLSPDGSTSTDASVRIDGQTVTITQAGTYQVAGTLDDGALIVESGENAKITLVLGGVSIKNTTGAAIQIGTADDVNIELAEGTTNVLQSGEEVDIATATEGEEATGGALQSKVDLKIKGKGSLTVLDGKITVLTSYEGLEANQITLAGGELDITATDDGINANGGSDGFSGGFGGGFGGGRGGMGGSFGGRRNDTNNHSGDMTPPDNSNMQNPPDGNAPSGNPPTMPGQDAADSTTTDDTTDKQPVLLITGGKITVNADGDGLDSNGNLRVEGGDITVNGPSNGGNGALDIGTENGGAGVIAGGTLIALGTSSMAENFGSTSTQCAFLVTMNSFGAGETITITDSQGNVLYTGVTVKSANSVVFSSADLVVGETYTVTIGSNSATVTQSSTVVGNSNGFGGGFGRH